jgi:hypothetical protein
LEFGLQVLHRELVPSPPNTPNWQVLIDDIENEIARRDKQNPLPPDWKAGRQFYYDAARHFRFFREPRNKAVHVEWGISNYVPPDGETSRRIFDEVKHFMQHLATKLKQ